MNNRAIMESHAVTAIEYASSHAVIESLVNGEPRTADGREIVRESASATERLTKKAEVLTS